MTPLIRRFFTTLTACAAIGAVSGPALANEPTADRLAAARAAINALGATDTFDLILPNAAQQLKTTMIQATPHLQDIISVTVDETALALAGRRADLEREAAMIYARAFSVEELKSIETFFVSDAGKKLIAANPVVTRMLLQAAEIWSNGISRDLATATQKTLRARLGRTPAGGRTPSGGAAARAVEPAAAEAAEPVETGAAGPAEAGAQ